MATPWQIRIPASDTGLLKWKQTDETAAKVSELLQKDLEIVHFLLTLYATGASPDVLEQAYAENHSYQIPAMNPHTDVVKELKSGWSEGSPYLGKGKYYPDFLKFFQDEIDDKGWEKVLLEYVFKGDERSEAIFGRLFAGFLHPLIQLMYGIEWQQPAIIAEGLAQAAVHENRAGGFLTKVEQAAASSQSLSPSLPELFESVRQYSEKLATSARFEDSNKIYDGVFVRAPDEALKFLKQVKVKEDELDERLAEMKARILEWKIRLDLVQYIARGCPPLRLDAIKSFSAPEQNNSVTKPADLLPRFYEIIDDGHTIKVVRALLIAQELSQKYSGKPWIRIADEETWLKVHQILLQSTEGPQEPALWVRSAGFDEAWANVPKAGLGVDNTGARL
ncbi:hypothetical protein ACHAQJ_005982 [Trichoderma viride]